jgi:hypothetical protein
VIFPFTVMAAIENGRLWRKAEPGGAVDEGAA